MVENLYLYGNTAKEIENSNSLLQSRMEDNISGNSFPIS